MEDVISSMAKINRMEKFQEENTISTKYIDWIAKFSKKHPVIATDYISDVDMDTLPKYVQNNISNLEFFYNMIRNYAEANYIYPVDCSLGEYYSIVHNKVGYHVGVDWGQGVYFYCERLEKPEENAIPYQFIMSTVKMPRTFLIQEKLDEFTSYLEQLGEEVPVEAIQETTKNTLEKIKVKKIK